MVVNSAEREKSEKCAMSVCGLRGVLTGFQSVGAVGAGDFVQAQRGVVVGLVVRNRDGRRGRGCCESGGGSEDESGDGGKELHYECD